MNMLNKYITKDKTIIGPLDELETRIVMAIRSSESKRLNEKMISEKSWLSLETVTKLINELWTKGILTYYETEGIKVWKIVEGEK